MAFCLWRCFFTHFILQYLSYHLAKSLLGSNGNPKDSLKHMIWCIWWQGMGWLVGDGGGGRGMGGKPSWWRPACQLVGGVRGGGVFSKITVLDTLVLKSSMWFIHVWVVFTEPLTSRKTVITVEQVLKLWLHLYKFTCCLPFNDFQEAKTKRCGALSLLRMHCYDWHPPLAPAARFLCDIFCKRWP